MQTDTVTGESAEHFTIEGPGGRRVICKAGLSVDTIQGLRQFQRGRPVPGGDLAAFVAASEATLSTDRLIVELRRTANAVRGEDGDKAAILDRAATQIAWGLHDLAETRHAAHLRAASPRYLEPSAPAAAGEGEA